MIVGLVIFAVLGIQGGVRAQCPEITITEKYDHNPSLVCRQNGWDTIVNCKQSTLQLHAVPFITTQHFNGTYLVEEIPYNPPDTTFHAGSRLNISTDDAWENASIQFPFTFMFFGKPYTSAVVGSNGLVSFDLTRVGQTCPYAFYSQLPIPNPSFPVKNAIYGVYEDIDPGGGLSSVQGMFRSIGGTYPCRYLCSSVNGVPLFSWSSHQNQRSTYQIVCYEGTNIIEVHIKQRSCCATANQGEGLIGIQNETGTTQLSHYHDADYHGDYTFYVEPNSPGAFVAPNRGNQSGYWLGTTEYEAWRFTPQGETTKNISWWRFIEDRNGNIIDSVEFTNVPGDTNGYYLNTEHTLVNVSPSVPTRYMVKCVYRGANGYLYGVDGESMRDTIFVGVDTSRELRLSVDNGGEVICEGRVATVRMGYPATQSIDSCSWSAVKILNGDSILMPPSALTDRFTYAILNSQAYHLTPNHIDTTLVYCTATFSNGCHNYNSVMIQTLPNYVFYDTAGVCEGGHYEWCDTVLRTEGEYMKHFWTEDYYCDSTRHIHFVVSNNTESTDYVEGCKPFTWINGHTYSATNSATRATDTVHLKNAWGCDSTVYLDFTFIPMKAIIEHSPEVATLDELTVELRNASYGYNSHVWLLPDGSRSISPTTYVNFPLSGIDTMRVGLAVHNDHGCDDTAHADIPLHKVSQFIPNIFSPGRPDNNRWRPEVKGNIEDIKVWIYNRQGEQVFFMQGDDYWDGHDSSGNELPQGVYVYIMRFRSVMEPTMTQESTGTITLVR